MSKRNKTAYVGRHRANVKLVHDSIYASGYTGRHRTDAEAGQ